ncbi:MAG: nitronate monooxygenase, partial [Pseudomonadales bacterium]|nr:nitronate monooxygenase [Pseudomonadales bacterium]
ARILRAGAVGAQLGTAFIPCMESSAAPEHRTAVVDGGTPTEIMTAVSGRPARGFVKDWASLPSDAVPDYPVAYDAGKALAAAARAAGRTHFDVHWAGSGVGRGRALLAAALVAQLASELSDQGAP